MQTNKLANFFKGIEINANMYKLCKRRKVDFIRFFTAAMKSTLILFFSKTIIMIL